MRDPLLRGRYEEITAAVSDQLARGLTLEDLMGSRVDALKFVSSLTLFRAAADACHRRRWLRFVNTALRLSTGTHDCTRHPGVRQTPARIAEHL